MTKLIAVQCPGVEFDVQLRALQLSVFFVYFAYFVAGFVGIGVVATDSEAAEPFLLLVVLVTAAHMLALAASHALIEDYTRLVSKDSLARLYHLSDAVQLALFVASAVTLASADDLQTLTIAFLALLTVVQVPCFVRTYRLGFQLSGP
jgi:hypothetical protein